jgi:hypothetical protein
MKCLCGFTLIPLVMANTMTAGDYIVSCSIVSTIALRASLAYLERVQRGNSRVILLRLIFVFCPVLLHKSLGYISELPVCHFEVTSFLACPAVNYCMAYRPSRDFPSCSSSTYAIPALSPFYGIFYDSASVASAEYVRPCILLSACSGTCHACR